jgi:predicted methyltransferase
MNAASAFIAGGLSALLLAGCGRQEAPSSELEVEQVDHIAAAVSDETRPAAARVQDSYRKPTELLAFAGVGPDDVVVEIQPASGYFTALLSRVVGPDGLVYAIDSERLFEFMPTQRDTFSGYVARDPRDNVRYQPQRLDELDLPDGIDQVWMVQFYHDTIWLGIDRAAMNRAFFDRLKPGGVYLVVDHHGLPGAGEAIARDLHRVDASTVRAEIEQAGFVLEAESGLLTNPDDPRTDSIFDHQRRGRTDQFVWRFIKPGPTVADSGHPIAPLAPASP